MRGRQLNTGLSNSRTINRQKLVEVDQKYALMTYSTQKQVTCQLEDELDYLIGRKERQAMKRKKIQQMQELYEQQRSSRLSRINLKASRSQVNRQHELSSRKAKSKKELDHFNTVRKKVQHENEEELQKMLEAQKSFSKRNTDSRSSRTSLNPNSSRVNKSNIKRVDSDLAKSVEKKIHHIEDKMNNASINSKQYFSRVAEKARGYSHNFEEIMDKIRTKSVLDETRCINEYYQRATHIENAGNKSKSFFQKESQKRKKNIQEKFKTARRNLRIIDRERQVKNRDIQIKLDRTVTPKTWKNEKSETYLKKFISNQKDLERQKTMRAQQILKKHLDMSLRNKALREKTQKIHQTMKKIQI